ncbi:MAG: hypothetical protein PHX83_08020 [Acidobacteriia bacterium]|nr:hypothetical protein [Terriglobia bacterium]
MRPARYMIFLLLLLCPAFLLAQSTTASDNDSYAVSSSKKANHHQKSDSSVTEFKKSGETLTTHAGKAGSDLGDGSVKLASDTVQGEPIKGTMAFGAGVGGFGKNVGIGVGKSAAHAAKGTAIGVAKIRKIF